MVLIKLNSLKSDIFFNSIFIPGFSRSRFFRVQVLRVRAQGLGPGSRVRVKGPDPGSGSRVQGPGPDFRSSQFKEVSISMKNRFY